ncbi:hypothetical protein MKEN_00276300 [Mycena kentingensis (nom. inval.)]|nr:hypothetical protein MKEN_00276300 [Mycena kentingensis (nom. inval.)]
MPAPTLPPEIINLVVNAIDPADRATLRACSLASLAFRLPAQKRLHEHVFVSCGYNLNSSTSFDAVLARFEAHPRLAGYARTLTVSITNTSSIPVQAAAAATLLRRLVNLRRLRVTAFPKSVVGKSVPWCALEGLGLVDWITQQRLRFLLLRGVSGVPQEALRVLGAVEHVEVCMVTMANGPSGSETTTSTSISKTQPALSELSAICSPDVVHAFLQPQAAQYTTNLKTINLCWPEPLPLNFDLLSSSLSGSESDSESSRSLRIRYTVPLATRPPADPNMLARLPRLPTMQDCVETNRQIINSLVDAVDKLHTRASITLAFQYPCADPESEFESDSYKSVFNDEVFGKLGEYLVRFRADLDVDCVATPMRVGPSEADADTESDVGGVNVQALWDAFERVMLLAK